MLYSANVLPDEPRRVLTTRHDVPAFRVLGGRDVHCGDHSGHKDKETGVGEVHAWADSATMLHVRTRHYAGSNQNSIFDSPTTKPKDDIVRVRGIFWRYLHEPFGSEAFRLRV